MSAGRLKKSIWRNALSLRLGLAVLTGAISCLPARAADTSAPVILQYFESKWSTMQSRMPDVFMAGYGAVWTPPPGRSLPTPDGGQVGYDIYDRFDLGKPGDPTFYGTENGYKSLIQQAHQMGGDTYVDFVHHHVGSWDVPGYTGNPDASGHMNSVNDYPGFVLSNPGQNNADTYADPPPANTSDPAWQYQFRLAHLITLNQTQHTTYIRNPVPGYSNNVPTSGQLNGVGRIANVPDDNNRRFYPDPNLPGITVSDPVNGGTYTIHPYNLNNPLAGQPVAEDVTGYLMRYAQWLVQVMGVDGLRIDAARHVPLGQNGDPNIPALIDRAVYRASNRYNLDGTQRSVFQFQEVYNGDPTFLQSFVRKDINPSTPNVVGANRDVLDFPMWFAMQNNLSSNGLQNNWYNIRNSSQDAQDDGVANNGSESVGFVINHDNGGVYLSNVAHAWVLTRPGNAYVYFNAHEFDRSSEPNFFLQDGRGDALGGVDGNIMTTLVNIRNTHGRGNFIERWIDSGSFSNVYAYERDRSMLVGLNSALGTTTNYDERDNIHTNFAPGTLLLELTGNAGDPTVDPSNQIPQVLTVNSSGNVNLRIPRNENTSGVTHGRGYVIYGLAGPQGTLSIPDKASTIAGATPTQATNATAVLANIDVVKSNSFTLEMDTRAVKLLNSDALRDHNADGDNALFKVDGGIALNGDAQVDFNSSDPSQSVVYGFEQFKTVHYAGYYSSTGAGQYTQTIDTTKLGQGYHYITTRVFRHSDDSTAPAVYSDFRDVIYVDLSKPVSALDSFNLSSTGGTGARTLEVKSVDQTADHVNVLLDQSLALSDAQVLAQVGSSNLATQTDPALFWQTTGNVQGGNHTATIVTYKVDGTYSIQRYNAQQQTFLTTTNATDSGIGHLSGAANISATDINQLSGILNSSTPAFSAAADVNADGIVDLADTFLMGPVLSAANVDQSTWDAFNGLIYSSTVTNGTYTVNGTNDIYEDTAGITSLNAAASLTASFVRGGTLAIAAQGKATIRANPTSGSGTSKISVLNIAGSSNAWTGQLDLTNNSLVVESNASNRAADLARVVNQLRMGYDQGKWDGKGITSSSAAGDTASLHTLGVLLNDDGQGDPLVSSFAGQSADTNSILVKYTFYGDANLDGTVNSSDYSQVDNGFNSGLTGWYNGDFNYDGVVNSSDYSLIDNTFNQTQGLSASSGSATALIASSTAQISPTATAVPEPGSASLIAIAAIGMLARNRRSRRSQA